MSGEKVRDVKNQKLAFAVAPLIDTSFSFDCVIIRILYSARMHGECGGDNNLQLTARCEQVWGNALGCLKEAMAAVHLNLIP
jgi:hypothetical protein